MKYRTKPVDPVTVDAFKYDGTLSVTVVGKDSDTETDVPEWAALAFLHGELFYAPTPPHGKKALFVKSSSGEEKIEIGAYIVKNDEGEIFGCKAEYFEKLYERYCPIQEYKPIRRLNEILVLDESELSQEEKERVQRVEKIPEYEKKWLENIGNIMRKEITTREKTLDAINDYLEGFTEGVKVHE